MQHAGMAQNGAGGRGPAWADGQGRGVQSFGSTGQMVAYRQGPIGFHLQEAGAHDPQEICIECRAPIYVLHLPVASLIVQFLLIEQNCRAKA